MLTVIFYYRSSVLLHHGIGLIHFLDIPAKLITTFPFDHVMMRSIPKSQIRSGFSRIWDQFNCCHRFFTTWAQPSHSQCGSAKGWNTRVVHQWRFGYLSTHHCTPREGELFVFLMESPDSSIRCRFWVILSSIASPRVGSPIASCQLEVGS